MEDFFNYEFIYPGDSVKCIGGGEGYVDYLFSRVLACYGCVIRDLSLSGLSAEARVYKCIDGKRVKGYQFSIPPISPDAVLNPHLRYYLRRFLHSRDLIVRYPQKDDGSLGYPMWHTIFSGIYEISSYRDWRFSLLSDSNPPLCAIVKEPSCDEFVERDDTTYGSLIDVAAALRYNGFDANPQGNSIHFCAFGHSYSIHVHDNVLTMEGLYCPNEESVDLAKLSSACNKAWIGGHDFDYETDLSKPPVRLFYEFQPNETDLFSLIKLIPQMASNMHEAFNRIMSFYEEMISVN